jgi:hypothetical protein
MKKIICSSGLALTLILIAPSVQALEPFALLDDFLGDRIDESIWNGSRRPDVDTLDLAREVIGGQLRLMGRTYADNPAPGERNDDRVRLFFNNPAPITQMLALVRVNGVELTGCTDPMTVSQIRARPAAGFFFKHGGPGTPGDGTNDVFAAINIFRTSDSLDPPGVMQIVSQVFLCGDPQCAGGNSLLSDTTSLGTLSPGQSALLALVWDPDNDRFIFLRDSLAQFIVYNYNGILTDTDPPGIVHKRVELRAQIENCATGPRASGFMELLIDKFWVNQSATLPPQPLTWTLDNFTFADGGVASGTFVYEASSNSILDWNISVSGGDEATFPPFTYDPTTTEAGVATNIMVCDAQGQNCQPADIALELHFIIDEFALGGTPDSRVLALSTDVPLTDAGGTIPLNTTSLFKSRECFNCSPFRLVVTGSLVSVVP